MSTKKDIGNFYKEKLSEIDYFPSDHVWKRIEETLNKKKDRKIIILWFGLGILALISGFFYSSFYNSNKSETVAPIYLNPKNKNDSNNKKIADTKIDLSLVEENKTDIINSKESLNFQSKEQQHNRTRRIKSNNDDNILPNSNTSLNRNEQQFVDSNQKKLESENKIETNISISDTINKKESNQVLIQIDSIKKEEEKQPIKEKTEEEKKRICNCEIGVYVIPTYYNSFGNGSSIDPSLENYTKKGGITLSYRFMVRFIPSNKFSIRTGVGITNLNYTTFNIHEDASYVFNNYNNVSFNQNLDLNSVILSSSSFDLKQELSYIEIPLEALYTFSENKIDIFTFSGLSLNILTKNNLIVSTNDNSSTYIGSANNLSSISVSFNIGGRINYNFNNKLKISVEPIFRYYFNTYKYESVNFKPYSIGVAGGLLYDF